MIQTWFKIFFRNSKKNWLNMLVNILGLTLGFAGLLIVLLYLNDEQSYNAYNPKKEEIYRVLHKMPVGGVMSGSNNIEGQVYKEGIPEIKEYHLTNGRYSDALVKVKGKELFSDGILEGDPNFFDFFPFPIIEGNEIAFQEARNHIAISEEQASIFFGTASAIGETIEFSNRTFIITTVYKIVGKHYFMPNIIIQYQKQPENLSWGNLRYNLFVKKTKEATEKVIENKALAIWYKNYVLPSSKREGITTGEFIKEHGVTVLLESIKDIRLKTIAKSAGPEGKGNYKLILIMLSLSVLLIIISCVNFMNLSIASAGQRAKEVGVKKTLGLSKLSLTVQYALETVLQGGVAFVFSVLLVELILPSFNDFSNKDISIFEIDVLIKVALLVVIVLVVIGSVSALYVARFKAVEVLKGNVSRSKKGVFLRDIMLGIQFLISGFFLTGAFMINKQVTFMLNRELGFNGDQVVVVTMNKRSNRFKKYQLAQKELGKHPGIVAVTSNSVPIGGRGSGIGINIDYKDIPMQTRINAIDYDYLAVMDIQILKGRGFKEELASDTINHVLINETLAKARSIYEDPIGKEIRTDVLGGKVNTLKVIGIVKDYNVVGLDHKIEPTIFVHWNAADFMKNFALKTIQFKIKPTNVEATISYIENYWKENIEQGYPFNASFVNERFAKTYKKYQNQQAVFFILTMVVILISLLGLFALASLTIQQRLKEVAIRKTLGSSVNEIMFQLIKSFLKITLIASVVLIPISYYFMQNWLDNFAYSIEMPLTPFIITPIILAILVFVIVGLKAYNATKVDLIKHLKYE